MTISIQADLNVRAQAFSELLLLNITLGNGCDELFNDRPGLVYASGVSREVQQALRTAERSFHRFYEQSVADKADRLRDLEDSVSSGAGMPRDVLKACRQQIEDLKRELSLIPAVSWRDCDVHRSTLVELLKKSAYRSMAFLDELGTRASYHMLIPCKMTQEAALSSLTVNNTNDVTLIRSATSGGASIHSLVGTEAVAFRYMSCLDRLTAHRLCKRIKNKPASAALRGRTILIPAPDADTSVLPYRHSEIFEVLRRVYARGNGKTQLKVTYESAQVEADWKRFLSLSYSDLCGKKPSEAVCEALLAMPAYLDVLAAFASKAVLTRAVYDAIAQDPGTNLIRLTNADLEQARGFVEAAFILTSGVDHISTRSDNAAKARASLAPSAKRMQEASDVLEEAIRNSPEGLVSRKAAIALPGVTAGVLDALVAREHKFTELRGKENIRCGKITRGYILRAEAEMDAEEALSELEAATPDADPAEAETVFRELQAQAEINDQEHCICAVPVTRMTPRQIQHLPALLKANPCEAALRGTPERPEPDHLFENDEDDVAACFLRPGIPNLWFRFKPDGTPFRNWDVSRLDFPEWKTKNNND